MAATGGAEKRTVFHLARTCQDLFFKFYAKPRHITSNICERAEIQHERFHLWASYLGVFASYNASLDKRLEHSDGIQDLVVQLLHLLHLNLEFVIAEHPKKTHKDNSDLPHPGSKLHLEGTNEEALDAVEVTITRLNKLGSSIRRYSSSSLDSRVKAFTEKHGDENYMDIARQIVRFKYRTASPSLHEQLAVSMSARRHRLRYIRRHQEKLSGQIDNKNEPAKGRKAGRPLPMDLPTIEEAVPTGMSVGSPSGHKEGELQVIKQNIRSDRNSAVSATVASSFRPTQSAIARLKRGDGATVVSSLKGSMTFMAEDLAGYPEPPKREQYQLHPSCPFCCEPLQELELEVKNWQRHVNKDLKPFVCISENCSQPPQVFETFGMWTKHMKDLHSPKWTQLVHKPIIWRCDVGHPEVFCKDEDEFEDHLNSQHGNSSAAARKAIFRTSRILQRRGPHTCPLCGYDLSAVEGSQPHLAADTPPNLTNPENTAEATRLVQHIAGHLRRLAFDSANNLNIGADGDVSHGSTEASEGKTQYGSKARPSSNPKDLSEAPLIFNDDERLRMHFATRTNRFDPDWSSKDVEYLTTTSEELPETANGNWLSLEALSNKRQDSHSPNPVMRHFYQQQIPQRLWNAWRLNNLGNRINYRYSRTTAISDFDKAVRVAREAVATAPIGHLDRALLLHNLGVRLGDRFSKTGAMGDLDEAIRILQEAVTIVPRDYPDYASLLDNLGVRLGDRYSRTGATSDLGAAIQVAQAAVDATPQDHPSRPSRLNNLGVGLGDRYSRTGDRVDLETAIQLTQQAIDATPIDYPDRALLFNNLAVGLGDKYSRTGALSDLEDANRIAKEAVDATPGDHLDRALLLNNLGHRLSDRYSRTGAIDDLESAIRLTQQAIDTSPRDHPDRALILHNLGNSLASRYSRIGEISNLNEAIQVAKEAVDGTPKGHPNRALWLNDLGVRLGDRYLRTGAIGDLDEAIRIIQKTIAIMPRDHPEHALFLDSLGVRLGDRYSRTGATSDLSEAIQVAQAAVDATPKDHPSLPRRLNNLGNRLSDRYSRAGTISDLEKAVQITREAVEATPEDHPNYALLLDSLGVRLGDRYLRTGATSDLSEAIQVAQAAVDVTPKDHPSLPRRLNNLGNRLSDRYSRAGTISDLKKAVQITREAVEATPKDHPNYALLLNNLGDKLGDRFSRTEAIGDLEQAVSFHQVALRQTSSFALARIRAGKQVLYYCAIIQDWQQAYEASSMAIYLISQLTGRSLEASDKQHILNQVAGLASDAAAAALYAARPPLDALALLEEGRGILATSLEDMRTDVSVLGHSHPGLAEQFKRLRDELDQPVGRNNFIADHTNRISSQAQVDRRYDASKELDTLIIKIREHSGFENFLLAPSEGDLRAAARFGPIVVINVSKYRCDAILIEESQIRILPLLSLNIEDIEKRATEGHLGNPKALEWLWDVVARPVLDALAFVSVSSDDVWPHVWWIPTGPLTKFPLHAAGYHNKAASETVLDRVMSSYSSSVKAIIYGRRRRNPELLSGSTGALLVAMRDTPGYHHSLPFATEEVNVVRRICESMGINPVEPEPCKQAVTSQLRHCRLFHFAGHNFNAPDPSQSQLLLNDWKSEPFTVATLLEMNLRGNSPFLAYLSAYGTGQVQDERFTDESIHLISACQLAGFRHCIGTLWDVSDRICVDMARLSYEKMREKRMTDESVCLGLHFATRILRANWVNGIGGEGDSSFLRHVTLEETSHPAYWIPFVHVGV
ncbi:hypothetical protein QQS21_002505 [Conoideocrella luteorostrata]|uniref:CHAT domain-containing protein n=1 Tax=Conoideocrella luteorostrata TaxID=1105319 RepID=A0AAJ0G196_9HYPO|nr:hypothetical protein QQS21_002505 [Conoideocrella luteorostrata]